MLDSISFPFFQQTQTVIILGILLLLAIFLIIYFVVSIQKEVKLNERIKEMNENYDGQEASHRS